MTEKEIALHEKIASMEGDVRAVIGTFKTVAESFGLNLDDFQGGDKNTILSKLPKLVSTLSLKLSTGGFEELQNELGAITPILEKYKHLTEDVGN